MLPLLYLFCAPKQSSIVSLVRFNPDMPKTSSKICHALIIQLVIVFFSTLHFY